MPIGEHRTPARGFSYLLLLFSLAALGAGLAALGTQWQAAAQRERETELLWRGLQWRDALQRFHDQTPEGQPALPQQPADLLHDKRWPTPRHHLRQAWADPFTGAADWVLLRDADGGIVGLHSRSQRPLQRRHGLPPGIDSRDAAPSAETTPATVVTPLRPTLASEWLFVITPRRPAAGRPNPAGTASSTRPTP